MKSRVNPAATYSNNSGKDNINLVDESSPASSSKSNNLTLFDILLQNKSRVSPASNLGGSFSFITFNGILLNLLTFDFQNFLS